MYFSSRRRLPKRSRNNRFWLSPMVTRFEEIDDFPNPPPRVLVSHPPQGALVSNPPQGALVLNTPQPAAVSNPPQSALYEQLKNHFNKYDTSGNGRLSEHELRRAFAALGSAFPLVRVFSALEEADKDRDGCIGPEEWDALIQHTMTWYDGNSIQT